ncbi:hypothetical protein CR513_45977, partial [Mucuna pruriens]
MSQVRCLACKESLYQNSNVVGSDSLIDNLYMLDVVSSYNEILQIGSRGTKRKLIENSAILWHKRLGHISKQRIQRLVSDEILEPLDLSNLEVCVECIKGKRTNIRKLGAERAKDVLELIHTDICGPFPTASWNGQQYFITFIDDYSRYGYLYLIHEKSQSLDVFKSFKVEVELQLEKKIKVIKSDRGGEYYGRYDGSGEQRPGPFALFLREWNVVFEEEFVNDIGQVLVLITVQETTPVIGDNVQTIIPNIVPEQDYDEALPQTPIEQPQQVSLRRSIRERRHAIPDDYIVFLQEHKDGIGLTEDDPINFCQACKVLTLKNGLIP